MCNTMTSAHRAGALTGDSGSPAVRLFFGELAALGPLRLLAHWEPKSGLRVVVLTPLHMPGLDIRKSGRRQAGAFLLKPGESFSMGKPPAAREDFRLEAEPLIRVPAGEGAWCGFCRMALPAAAPAFALLSQADGIAGRLLCRACAAAWRTAGSAASAAG
jgi:hypothetical protein